MHASRAYLARISGRSKLLSFELWDRRTWCSRFLFRHLAHINQVCLRVWNIYFFSLLPIKWACSALFFDLFLVVPQILNNNGCFLRLVLMDVSDDFMNGQHLVILSFFPGRFARDSYSPHSFWKLQIELPPLSLFVFFCDRSAAAFELREVGC